MGSRFIMGVDLGQVQDYTAIAIIERLFQEKEGLYYHLRHLERLKLGTSYPDVVKRVINMLNTEPLSEEGFYLVVDATGVGRPVTDLMMEEGLNGVIPVTITGGSEVTDDKDGYKVPKRDLVTNLQVLFQNKKLQIAEGLPNAKTLLEELMNFKVKISKTGHDSYEAWREGAHDDLVLAVALASWYGELNKFDFVDDLFLEEKEQTPGPYYIDSYMMKPEESWVIADYVKKEKNRR